MVTDQQVRLLMKELRKGRPLVTAAAKSGMSEPTARKWREKGVLPSVGRKERAWRTRKDPFGEHWEEIEELLARDPGLQAKAALEWLQGQHPGRYGLGQLRTLQRRFQQWRLDYGPDKELFFEQDRQPGQQCQSDFTHMASLEVTIQGETFKHLLYHFVLPYSRWEHVEIAASESFEALAEGLQESLWALGGVPREHRTDNLSAATHELRKTGGREYNQVYVEFLEYYSMEPSRNHPGAAHQNGSVESSHGHFKSALEQRLKLAGTRDFGSVDSYRALLRKLVEARNATRGERLRQEREALQSLPAAKLPAYRELPRTVSPGGTVRVANKVYSLPSRLRGQRVVVQLYASRVEIYQGAKLVAQHERARGKQPGSLDYRHLVGSLLRKPGAFAQYRYREEMFPAPVFRQAYDRLCEERVQRNADLEYLRILNLAAQEMQCRVERALEACLQEGRRPDCESIKAAVVERPLPVPDVHIGEPDLREYDSLLGRGGDS